MSEKIWIVMGSTGEYSDRTEWTVDAWRSEKEAQDRVTFLEEKMQELGLTVATYSDDQEAAIKVMRAHEPQFDLDYTGTRYFLCDTELKP